MTKFKDLKPGSKLSESQYYSVVKVAGDKVQLENDHQEMIVVDKSYVEKCLTSGDQFERIQNITKTEAANLLLANPYVVMTVNFNKQVKEADVKKQMHELYPNKGGKILSEADFKKNVNTILKSALEGTERSMVGRHWGELNELGRVNFCDMEATKEVGKAHDSRQRQVDPRSINWMIIKGTKYVVK